MGRDRYDIDYTRSIVRAICENKIDYNTLRNLPGFNLAFPSVIEGIQSSLLDLAQPGATRNITKHKQINWLNSSLHILKTQISQKQFLHHVHKPFQNPHHWRRPSWHSNVQGLLSSGLAPQILFSEHNLDRQALLKKELSIEFIQKSQLTWHYCASNHNGSHHLNSQKTISPNYSYLSWLG